MKFATLLVLVGFLIVASGTIVQGCRWEKHRHTRNSSSKVEGSGNVKSETRNVGQFHGVRLEGVGKVLLTQGDESGVRIEADDNILPVVTTRVSGGMLVIGMEEGNLGDVKVIAHVTVKDLQEVHLSGAGSIECVNELECESLECSLTGVGDIELKGSCQSERLSLSGVGKIENRGMVAKLCNARVTGVGSCEVNATESLEAKVSGMGKITYFGNPPQVKSEVTGMGSVREG